MNTIKKSALILLLAAPLLAYGEDQTVSVSENDLNKSVTFESATMVDDTKHRILINNASTDYWMDLIDISPDDDNDKESWRCIASSTSGMLWKIVALKQTALTYVINGGLTKVVTTGGGGASDTGPDKKAFKVTVPAETVLTWENSDGSHANKDAKHRLKIAVGERVTFTVKNSHLGNPSWTTTGGKFRVQGLSTWSASLQNEAKVEWSAPSSAGSCTVTATFPSAGSIGGNMSQQGGNTAAITFDVRAADGESVERIQDLSASSGLAITVKMTLRYTLQPQDMFYGYSEIEEDGAPASVKSHDVKGYFKYDPNLDHIPNPWTPTPLGNWDDTAGSTINPLQQSNGNKLWINGSCHWLIPLKHRGKDPAGPTSGPGVIIDNLKQEFIVQTTSPNNLGPDDTGVVMIGTNSGYSVRYKCIKSADHPNTAGKLFADAEKTVQP